MIDGGRTDRSHGLVAGHPGKDVSACEAEVDDRRVAGGGRLRAVRASGDDSVDPAGGVTLKPDRVRRDQGHSTEIDARRPQPLGGARGNDPGKPASLAHGLDLGRSCCDDDLVCPDVEHLAYLAVIPGDERRSGIDPHDLDPIVRVHHVGFAPGGTGLGGGGPTRSRADDRQVDGEAVDPDLDVGCWLREVGRLHDRERRLARGRVSLDDRSGPGRRQARPDIGDTVDGREAVAAVAGQAQRPTPARHLARTDDRDRD